MNMNPQRLAVWLRGVEEDLSLVTNGTKASDLAYQRIIDRCAIAAKMLEAFSKQD